ncbi:PTPA-domain-containing protein [Scenedesmus sp. NREL 46B-D3]|nr:PTPA-domain-containing protein [Scenedesmus sp. NREL 46B-D3]
MGPPSSQLHTGRPVQGLIQTEPQMPPLAARAATASSSSSSSAAFVQPCKAIQDAEGLKKFLQGSSVKSFVAFILSLNQAVAGTKLSQPFELSPCLALLKGLLDDLWGLVDATPPVQQSLRYGNPAFRTWFAGMMDRTPQWVGKLLPMELQGAAVELLPYLLDSFGNATRIDYGTGHETTFVAFLYCLAALGLVTESDRQALVCVVFNRYLELMRHIQTTYWLEPAGSHGVWGLDDYQFLPFVWGSGQLLGHPLIKPKSIHNEELLSMYGDDYMYLACIKFVKAVKKGALQETSPMLDDVSSVPNWAKVNSGMVKMYQVEVLSKFPIMQHFLFGSLLPFE